MIERDPPSKGNAMTVLDPEITSFIDLDAPASDRDGSTTFPGLPGHFCLHYQPQLELRSGAIVSCEALLRWWHPGFGLLRPQTTLGGTRWTDDLPEIEEWALIEACRQAAAWKRHGLPVQVAVNVSVPFLLAASFGPSLDRALAESGLHPRHLAVDIPFGVLATHPLDAQQVIGDLAAAEVGVIIDGVVGDAHPWMIDRIRAQAWKIDLGRGSAGHRPLHVSGRRALDHAHEAGAQAVAKAVEDDRRLVELRSMGFDAVFGTAVSPPLPPEEVRSLFRPASTPRVPLFGTAS